MSKDTLDVLNKAGGIESTGQLGKDGLPIIGKKPEKPSKEDRLINQFRKTQVQKLSSDIVKNKIPELEKTLLDIDSEFAKFKRTPDGKIEIPGYGAGPNALPAWMLTAEGKKMRQKIGTAAELLLRQRSGAAINESEEKRLRGLAGVNPLQTEGEILTGLELIRNTATSVKEAISGGYSPDVLQEYLNNKQNAPKEFNPLSKGNEGKAVTITKEADDVFSFIGKGK